MAASANIETATGRCPEHGLVQGTRETPKARVYGPASLIVYLFRNQAAKRAPYACPYCARDIELADMSAAPVR